jgi:NADH-quinone oxidoreductase subunit H
MFEYKRKTVEYRGKSQQLAIWAGHIGQLAGPVMLRAAPLIFIGSVGIAALSAYVVARYVNPRLPWVLRDVVVIIGLLFFASLVAMMGIWAERKIAGRIQSRLGPMRTGGWHGWAQSIADGLKFVQKEDLIPKAADSILFRLAPYIAFIAAFTAFAAVPFGVTWTFRNFDVSMLFVLAMHGLEVLGVILAGWASNNKWSLYGAMREACQLVSYEIPMGLSLLIPVMAAGSVNLVVIGREQHGGWFHWLMFQNPFIFLSFFTYYIASLASCKRAPFDLPEGESELVAGFHTEYSGFRFCMFFFAEYVAMFVVSALATIMYLGGWNSPFGDPWTHGPIWFLAKCCLLMFVQMWLRWTLPRIRIDQVMHAGVKYLLPLNMILFIGNSLWLLMIIPYHLNIHHFTRYALGVLALGTLALVLIVFYGVWAVYGYLNSPLLLGRMARKHRHGA